MARTVMFTTTRLTMFMIACMFAFPNSFNLLIVFLGTFCQFSQWARAYPLTPCVYAHTRMAQVLISCVFDLINQLRLGSTLSGVFAEKNKHVFIIISASSIGET